MNIAIDVRWIRSEHIDGTSRYAIDLVSNLLQRDTEHRYLLLGDPALIQHAIPDVLEYKQAEIRTIPEQLLSIHDFWRTPRSLQALGIDIYHSPSYLCSPFTGTYKKIVTVFDVIPFLFLEALSKSRLFWKLFYATRLPTRTILQSANTIVTASENTKHDLIRLFNVSPDKIRVIGIGLDVRFHANISVPNDFFERYHLPQKFLVYVGRQDPYKGIAYLIQAFAMLPHHIQETCSLVIAGKNDLRYITSVHALIERLELTQRVRFLDYVPDSDLPSLYSAASLLVHPSLYEGFGLPPLEAMACGTPVVYADSSSLTELIGEAGYAVQPASDKALAAGIREMLEDTTVCKRYRQRGLKHVQRFSWDAVTHDILNMYACDNRKLTG